MPLLIVGSIGIDDIITAQSEARNVLGGSASYASIAAGLFDRVNLVGIVGDDFPQEYLALYKKKNVDLSGLEIVPCGKTFRWTGKYHPDFDVRETLSISLNVFETFRPKIPDNYRKTPYVLLSNIDPELQLSVLDQVQRPKFTAADTMDLWINLKRDKVKALIERVDLIVMNEQEAVCYTGQSNVIRAGKLLLKHGVKYAIIKKGSHGAVLFSKRGVFQAPAYPIETVVDPTGAGDCFIGGLMGYLSKAGRHDLDAVKKGVVYGTVIAASSVEGFSLNRLMVITRKLIQKRYEEIKAMTRF
jgi:cytidine kinase